MLNIICALPCEAKAIIQQFHLKYCPEATPFRIYKNEKIQLIVSGTGKIKAATAVSYLHLFSKCEEPIAWLNIGISGGKVGSVGEGFLVHKITDNSSSQTFFPSITFKTKISSTELITVEKPETCYTEKALYDMESSGFFLAATHFTPVDSIHCYKILSDCDQESREVLNKKSVEELIKTHSESIEELATLLEQQTATLHASYKDLESILKKWTFSETEKHQLKRLLHRFEALLPSSTPLNEEALSYQSGKEFLKKTHEKLSKTPLHFT